MAELENVALPEIDGAELTELVRKVLNSPTAEPLDRRMKILSGGLGAVTHGVYRLSGTAEDRGRRLPWSLILKVLSLDMPGVQSFFEDESHPLYWKREAIAYQSGLLDDLPGGVGAPRCYGVVEKAPGTSWLWLEDLGDAHTAGWSPEDYARAALALGRFNGAYLSGRSIPAYPWLVRNGSPRGLLDHNLWIRDLIADPSTWRYPLVRSVFAVPVAERLLQLWDEREKLLGVLDRVPQTFCHLDAWRMNMFASYANTGKADIILVDWAYPGRAAIGTDAGDLFGESFTLAELGDTKPRILDQTIYEGYLDGLRDAGWHFDPDVIRFAFTAFCALKHLCFLAWLHDLQDERKQCRWERLFKRSFADFAARQAELVYYLLDLAVEARDLANRRCQLPVASRRTNATDN